MKNQQTLVLIIASIAVYLLVACSSKPPCGGTECTESTFIYLQEGDCDLKADIYSPSKGEATPVILWLHPGGMITGGRNWIDTNQLAQYIEAGYTVVAIDYRLAPEHRLETIVADVEAAHKWLISEGPDLFNIDPTRIAVIGHSAGGYLTLLSGFHIEPQPKALVVFYGYGDLTGDWATKPSVNYNQGEKITREKANHALHGSGTYCIPADSALQGRFDYYVYTRQQGTWPLEISGHDPVSEVAWFRAYEPVWNVAPGYPPTMLLHGRADTDVPFSAAEHMADALNEQGVPNKLVSPTGWNHIFDQMEAGSPDVEATLRQVLTFLDLYVK